MVSETATVDDADALSFSPKRELSIRDNDEYFDWTVRVEVDKFALRGRTFSVLIFLGDVPSNATQWRSAASFVGSVTAFATPLAYTGRPGLIEGFVHLNNFIAEHSGLHSFDPDEVRPYLKKNLAFRIQTVSRSNRFMRYLVSQFRSLVLSPSARIKYPHLISR